MRPGRPVPHWLPRSRPLRPRLRNHHSPPRTTTATHAHPGDHPGTPRPLPRTAMAPTAMSRYVARLAQDSSGTWFVTFPDLPHAHTYGRSLRQAKMRAGEVLSLWTDDDHAAIVFQMALPLETSRRLEGYRSLRDR